MPAHREPPAFIGRTREREELHAAFDAAASGSGGVALVSGDAGIGKTHLVREVARYASSRGAAVYWGRCYESGGAPPFWPWVQVGRAASQAGLISQSPELAPLFPGLVDPAGGPQATGDGGRFFLFEAFAAFLGRAATALPSLLIIEDIQWADEASLDLLAHVARGIDTTRLLVVLTLRDGEDANRPPVARALAAVSRDPGLLTIALKPFTRSEIEQFAASALARTPEASLIDHLETATAGNPFFLWAVARELASIGSVPGSLSLAPGASAFLAARLASLSAGTQELLKRAAILGREFATSTLAVLEDDDSAVLGQHLDEALAAHVIAEAAGHGRYQFVHALMQRAVLDGMTPNERRLLHGRAAEVIEERTIGPEDERIPALARHYRESAALRAEHIPRSFVHAKAAAREAERRYAWQTAIEHYRYCLEVQTGGRVPGEDRAWLLTRLATCQLRLVHPATPLTAQEAMRLYRERKDGPGFAEAALAALEHPATWENSQTLAIAEEALGMLNGEDPEVEGRLLALLAEYWIFREPYQIGEQDWLVRLQEAAARHPSPRVTGAVHYVEAARARVRGDFETVYHESMRVHAALDEAGQYMQSGIALLHVGDALTWMGKFDDAVATGLAEIEFGISRGSPYSVVEGATLAGHIAVLRSDAQLLADVSARAGSHTARPISFTQARVFELRGDAKSTIPATRRIVDERTRNDHHVGMHGAYFGTMARLLHSAGETDEARNWVEKWSETYRELDSWDPVYSLRAILGINDALTAFGTEEIQRLVYRRLDILRDFRVQGWLGLDHLRGDLAMKLGSPDEAAAWYELGLEWANGAGSPIEEGLNLRGLAEVAAGEGRVGAALELGDGAAAKLEEAGAEIYLRPLRQWLATLQEGGRQQDRAPNPGDLSDREMEVVRLIAEGASNQAIADALVISRRTVDRHVSNILLKLEVANRTEVATWAVRAVRDTHSSS